jgi:PilZ domain
VCVRSKPPRPCTAYAQRGQAEASSCLRANHQRNGTLQTGCPGYIKIHSLGVSGSRSMAEEKRAFDRIEMEHSIRILGDDGSSFPAIAANISLTGMLVLCDRPTLERITPHGLETHASHEVPIRVRLTLPGMPENQGKLGLFGRVVGVRSGGQDEFRIGVQFTDYEPGSYNALEHYLDTHL